MPVKLAACDPCRRAKLACDHERPVCSRCRSADRAANCIYRSNPFKRRKTSSFSPSSDGNLIQSNRTATPDSPAISIPQISTQRRHYPNPGYLGSSSHETIFNHLRAGHDTGDGRSAVDTIQDQHEDLGVANDVYITQGTSIINHMSRFVQMPTLRTLVKTWISKGTNLALAGLFTEQYVRTAESCLELCVQQGPRKVSESLYAQSARPLVFHATSTIEEFAGQFCSPNSRWETLGLFFAAVSRAAATISVFKPLYETERQRRGFLELALRHSDQCLEACLSIDCLNDLQLMLQYENFICHSCVHGDQSHHSWRKLGDVASSLFALGYHEQIEGKTTIPSFLTRLRKAAFARAYSADKNVSIFLGRPPRIHLKYCRFELPLRLGELGDTLRHSNFIAEAQRLSSEPFDYMMDTEWSFKCAVLKEEILQLSKEEQGKDRDQRLLLVYYAYSSSLPNHHRALQVTAESQWQALPAGVRLNGPLRISNQHPAERDFMVSAKLNHLHVLLLLRLALGHRIPNSDPQLVIASASMLSLVADAMILKDHLVNSGTGLVWKVAYYGLPAAGITCLYLLDRSLSTESWGVHTGKLLRDLGILIAEVETGALVRTEEPNYALLAEATRTIKNIVDRVASGKRNGLNEKHTPGSEESIAVEQGDYWLPWDQTDFCDFELDFWLNLAEHPILLRTDIGIRE